ncbi:hypothetical protein [Litoribacillus peritrichatus]|uniref:Uncharacterized protein n=1 Tax=Litoribacillus peritrichatus TaxID=718191 RepID=A0ABP7M5M5_9GAMM
MSTIEKLAGKLISAIQKEWGNETGELCAEESEDVMYRAHDILQACKSNELTKLLKGTSVTIYLGKDWVENHPSVKPFIKRIENEILASL